MKPKCFRGYKNLMHVFVPFIIVLLLQGANDVSKIIKNDDLIYTEKDSFGMLVSLRREII